MDRHIILTVSAALAALTFVGCKPTENNYKAAYDAALAKRQQAAEEQMRPATGLLNDEGPQLRIVNGDTVYVMRERLRLPDGAAVSGKWGVAVSLFKMDTNARAAAAAIKERGFDEAMYVRASGDRYYTLSAVTATLDSAIVASRRFSEAFPDYPYIGLPGAPVIISY